MRRDAEEPVGYVPATDEYQNERDEAKTGRRVPVSVRLTCNKEKLPIIFLAVFYDTTCVCWPLNINW